MVVFGTFLCSLNHVVSSPVEQSVVQVGAYLVKRIARFNKDSNSVIVFLSVIPVKFPEFYRTCSY